MSSGILARLMTWSEKTNMDPYLNISDFIDQFIEIDTHNYHIKFIDYHIKFIDLLILSPSARIVLLTLVNTTNCFFRSSISKLAVFCQCSVFSKQGSNHRSSTAYLIIYIVSPATLVKAISLRQTSSALCHFTLSFVTIMFFMQ